MIHVNHDFTWISPKYRIIQKKLQGLLSWHFTNTQVHMFWMNRMDNLFLQMNFLHSPRGCACQLSDIISRRFLSAFFLEAWAGLKSLMSMWKAFGNRIWLMSILHFLEIPSITYEKWGLRNWFDGGQLSPPTWFYSCLQPSYLMPLSSLQPFTLFSTISGSRCLTISHYGI